MPLGIRNHRSLRARWGIGSAGPEQREDGDLAADYEAAESGIAEVQVRSCTVSMMDRTTLSRARVRQAQS